ncbi:MAG: hypothetical protein HY064_17075 [Bacteroidetes bacterium]|nr:hypothetical protein [Bacteroidota bacterium]
MIQIAPIKKFRFEVVHNSELNTPENQTNFALNHYSFPIQPTRLNEIRIKLTYGSYSSVPEFIRVYFFRFSSMQSEVVPINIDSNVFEFTSREDADFWQQKPFIVDKIAFVQEPNFLKSDFELKIQTFRMEQSFIQFITGSNFNH